MNLSELFRRGSPYRKVLSAKIADAGHWLHQDFRNWHLDESGLWLAFLETPFPGRYSELFIPWAELSAVIDPAGPAGRLVPQDQQR